MAAIGAARPSPSLSQFVLKIHGRCNLACDHCYVYEHVDQSWRDQPTAMAPATVRAAATRIAEHAAQHGLSQVNVVLHGGEPLLVGPAALRSALIELRTTIQPVTQLNLRMQSNGLLLSEAICKLLAEFDVRVGISLDGDRSANDRHRRYLNGTSSHDGVLQALELLRRPAYRGNFSGILCTVDIRNDPIEVYEALLAQQPPRLDLLLPHATWDRPPDRPDGNPGAYGQWLGRIYRRWTADGRPVPIRLFDSLHSTGAGGPSGTEWVGLDPADLAVIETDGTWEQVDSLKTSYAGAAHTGLNVFSHTADQLATHPGIMRRQTGLAGLCDTCRACPVVHQCGGGLFAHRYRSSNGFDNPSVYCADILELLAVVNERPAALAKPPDTAPVSLLENTASVPLPADTASVSLLEDIATGYGDAANVGYLAEVELAITRALVVAVAEQAGPIGPVALGWDLLARLDRSAPHAVRSVLAHPYVRAWAAACLDRTRIGADPLHLCSLAAVAAIRAGVEVELPVPVHAGQVILPTLGTLRLGGGLDGTAMVSMRSGGFTVGIPGTLIEAGVDMLTDRPVGGDADPAWRASLRLVTDGLTVHIEDQDRYRDAHRWTADGTLSDQAEQAWRRSLTEAWQVIRREVPGQVPGVLAGLRVVAPLRTDPAGQLRSSTARHAFGAVGAALAGPDALAVMLVHELQHSKMGAVLDLVDLFDPGYRTRVTVGWRADPRPLEGALQGTYAHLGVADIWRSRTGHAAPDRRALEVFRRYRDWTEAAIEAISRTGALTNSGHRFVDQMATTMAGWSR